MAEKVAPGSADSVWTEGQLLSFLNAAFSGIQATFLLILDGLDEFEDEIWLLQTMKDLRTMSNVKMCVLSRPEVALAKTLQYQPRLRLQDLTKDDISKLIEERLIIPLSLGPHSSYNLIDQMTESAEGIFLWVDLIVKDLYAGHRFEHLLRRSPTTPRGFPT